MQCINISGGSCSGETRCYTRLEPSLSGSAMCGAGSSCVKISQPPPMFDLYGYFVPPERRGPPITLYRGCFVLDMLKVGEYFNVGKFCTLLLFKDFCYTSGSGLEYCWCSKRDLCNGSFGTTSELKFPIFMLTLLFKEFIRL